MKSQSSARRHCCLRWEGQVGIELQMPMNRWATGEGCELFSVNVVGLAQRNQTFPIYN